MTTLFDRLNAHARLAELAAEYHRPIKIATISRIAKEKRIEQEYTAILDKHHFTEYPPHIRNYDPSTHNTHSTHIQDNYL